MIQLQIGSDQQIDEPTSTDISSGITSLDTGEISFIRLVHGGDATKFTKAIRLQPGLFLLEYSDEYGHMAADEPIDGEDLSAVLMGFAGGDVAWVKRFSWAPVEL